MTQINSTNNIQSQSSATNDIQLECIIKVNKEFIHYKGVKEVRIHGTSVIVVLYEQYIVKTKELLQKYNVSTVPYVHRFYDADIIAVKSLKQE